MRSREFLIIGCITLFMTIAASAQDRMPPIPKDKMNAAQKKAADELISGRRGVLEGPFVPLLRSPEFLSRLQKMGEYLRYNSAIGNRNTEFLILITARQWTQQFEWDVHYPLALKAGVAPEVAEAIAQGRRPEGMSADEEMIYDFADELRRNRSVSDNTYAKALKRFGEQGIIDMTGVIGYYSMLGMIMNVARTPIAADKQPGLQPFPR